MGVFRRVAVGVTSAAIAAGSVLATQSAGPAGAAGKCAAAPVTVRILPGPSGTPASTAPTDFRVTDAVARKVPIVPQARLTTARDPKELAALERQAARTKLALYSLYLADFPVPRAALTGFGFGDVTPPGGKTVATMTVVPSTKRGLRAGSIVDDTPIGYEATTTFAPVSLIVTTAPARPAAAYDDVRGSVKVRELDNRSICLEMDVTFTRNGQTVAAAEGTVRAPVVKAARSFFFT